MIKSNIPMKRGTKNCVIEDLERYHTKKDVEKDIGILFYEINNLLLCYSKANIEEKEKIISKIIRNYKYSNTLENRIKIFKVLPKDYRNKKLNEIKKMRKHIFDYLDKEDSYISKVDAEILWKHQAESMKYEIVNSLRGIIKKQASVLYKLNNVKGMDDEIKIIKGLSGLIDKIEKFETYIKNSNFFGEDYKEAIVDLVGYIKKCPFKVLFN